MFFQDRSIDAIFTDTIEFLASHDASTDVPQALAKIVAAYGLRNAAYCVINLPGRAHREPYTAVTYSSDWITRYLDFKYMRHDPVISLGFASILPLNWDDIDASTARLQTFFGEAREFGVGHRGLSFPIRGRHGEQALFSITSDVAIGEWQRLCPRLMQHFQILAYHVHRLVLRSEGITPAPVRLAPREIECLRWAAMGKTGADIGDILGIGERTARFYLEQARHKLDASNITNAVAKALSLSIISI